MVLSNMPSFALQVPQGRPMSFAIFNTLRDFTALALLCYLLSACSVNGTYPDASEPDAAKLRFIANTENATLDYYDAQHCEGLTTGMLNNILMADTGRRVDMKVAPPADAKSYLEIKLKPGKEAFLRINTNGGFYVCGNAFNFTPQPREEYELTLDTAPGRCTMLLQRLTHIRGKDLRRPLPMFETGLPACNGRSPLFPKPFPDTPQRIALINAIVEASALSMPDDVENPHGLHEKLDSLITERKAQLGPVKLPEEYWAQYLQNLKVFEDEAGNKHERSLEFYKSVYRMRLQGTEDEVLKQWLHPTDETVRARVVANDKMMAQYYENTTKGVALETVNRHLKRMSQLDSRFDVCERFSGCWQY
jgi:hypothetical protein